MDLKNLIGAAVGALALLGALGTFAHRYLSTEEAVVEVVERVDKHEQQFDLVGSAIGKLTEAALANQAAKAARNEVCRALREAGRIERGECPQLADP